MLWLKIMHIAGIVIWIAGLLYLTALLLGHRRVRDQQDFVRIRMGSRFAYMGMVSPAAFVAVTAGGALLFVSDVLYPWMFVKLFAVGILIVAHTQYGFVLAHLADEAAEAPRLRIGFIATAIVVSAAAVLWLVLAKPAIPESSFPVWLTEPGFLRHPANPPPAPQPPPHLPRS